MSDKFKLAQNKTLKLQNVLIKELIAEDFENMETAVVMMESYIKSKGYQPIGPLIQYTDTHVNENGELVPKIRFMRQSTGYMHSVEAPYLMESEIKVKNCLYVRFDGDEDKFGLAYSRLQIAAYEDDIELKGDSYTIFVENTNGNMRADIFMETER